jgi:hypothetical protein
MMDTLAYIMNRFGLKEGTPPYNLGRVRGSFASLLRDLEFKTGAEIGVDVGGNSAHLLDTIPGLKLLSVDSWTRYMGHRRHRQSMYDHKYKIAKENLAPYPNSTVIRGYSVDVAKTIPDESLDFVFIDAGHDFLNVTTDIASWSPKVRKGGMVSGHDYTYHIPAQRCDVVYVVKAWTEAWKIPHWFVVERMSDKKAIWFWVK